MTNLKLLLFDFDGTLADTRQAIVLAKQEAMRRLGLTVLSEEACASTIGLTAKAGFLKLYPGMSDVQADECTALYRQLFEEYRLKVPPTLFDGVTETLQALQAQGKTLTIATARNKASLMEFLDILHLKEYFDYVLCGEDTQRLKPHPDAVLKTLEELHFAPEEALMIGDMTMDIEMGKRAGVYACGVTYGNGSREQLLAAGADVVIDSMQELLNVVGAKAD